MDTQKVRDLSTAQSPKATDFVMLITNLTNNVLEKCQVSALRDLMTTNSISDDEGNALTTGSDDKLYVPSKTEEIDIIESNVTNLTEEVNTISNDVTELKSNVETLEAESRIIDKWQSGAEGYRIWSDGYCEQWGFASGTGVVTFIKKFRAVPNLQVGDSTYYSSTHYMTAHTVTISNFVISGAGNPVGILNTYGTYWRANGYLADGEY